MPRSRTARSLVGRDTRTIVKHHTRLTPLIAKRVKSRSDRFWLREIDVQKEAVARAVFLLERAGCQSDSIALGLQDLSRASTDVLAGADYESDGFAHGCRAVGDVLRNMR